MCVGFQAQSSFVDDPYGDALYSGNKLRRYREKPSLKIIVSRIREKVAAGYI